MNGKLSSVAEVVLVLGLVLSTTGCFVASRYSITFQNQSATPLTDVRFSWDDYSVSAGNVWPGMKATIASPDAAYPENVVVEWRTPDGQLVKRAIDVASAVGKKSRWSRTRLVISISEEEEWEIQVSAEPGR